MTLIANSLKNGVSFMNYYSIYHSNGQ